MYDVKEFKKLADFRWFLRHLQTEIIKIDFREGRYVVVYKL